MTKKQILAELKKKFFILGEITKADKNVAGQEIREREGVMWYLVGVYEKQGMRMIRRNIHIYVVNEGTKNEQAFYAEKEPENMLTPPVDEWADVNGEVVRKGKDWAIVRRWEINVGRAEEIEVLVKKVNGELTEFEIGKNIFSKPLEPVPPSKI